MTDRMEEMYVILSKPYITAKEIGKILDVSDNTARKAIRDSNLMHYPRMGYLVDDVIKQFNLAGYMNRVMKTRHK